MTSLAEVYEGAGRANLRRLYLGTGLFVIGAVLVLIGITFFATGLGSAFGLGVYGAREVAGIAAGLGVPAVFVGVFTVLPASERERAAAVVGAVTSVVGVILFVFAYPERWVAAGPGHLALPVIVIYFVGAITAFWALFTAVVNFKTRNDPGGTVTLTRTDGGVTKEVEVPVSEIQGADLSGLGGVGILGNVDREAVERSGGEGTARGGDRAAPASDGGTQAEELRTPSPAEPNSTGSTPGRPPNPDRYCGNCSYFEYENTGGGIQPYCGYYEEPMDDMDPCEHWQPNAR